MKVEKKLPRPSVELLNEFNHLNATYDPCCDDEANNKIFDRLSELIENYDWSNEIFTDPTTGLKGIKDAAGQILVPANFEDFTYIGDSYLFNLHDHVAAMKEGKWGIVEVGSGNVLVDFRFDYLLWNPFAGLYVAQWDGAKDKYGYVTKKGVEFIPNILTANYYETTNGFLPLESNGKFGGIDVDTYHFVLPEYDDIDIDSDREVIFVKDGVKGYVVEETGEFVSVEQYEEDEKYADAYVYNTFI